MPIRALLLLLVFIFTLTTHVSTDWALALDAPEADKTVAEQIPPADKNVQPQTPLTIDKEEAANKTLGHPCGAQEA